jgi:hypothetical protein
MKIHQHIQAGLLVIDDLPDISQFIIRDQQGRIKKQFPAITPTITLDVENWITGWYKFIAITPASKYHFV